MRISGGGARGIPLKVPANGMVRPATDALRQAVFSSLAARVSQARFLDLFAGSGAYGLEAYSRGAEGGVFVEQEQKALQCLRQNAAAVSKSLGQDGSRLAIIQGDASHPPLTEANSPDLVFIDPPYETISAIAERVFAKLEVILIGKIDPIVVFEMPGECVLTPPGWTEVRRLGKGARQPTAAIFRRTSQAQ